MVNFIQKEDLSSDFTNDDSLASGGISVNKAQLVSADAGNQLTTGADDGLFVAGSSASTVPDASDTVTGVVNNDSLQELGGADKTIHDVRVGRGGGDHLINTALGNLALQSNTTGVNNTALGNLALQSNTTGDRNTANGNQTLASNTTGDNNTAVGSGALRDSTTGDNNTAVGSGALNANTAGENNTAVGCLALNANTAGENNTANGNQALRLNTTGFGNTANGNKALNANTAGSNNTANGNLALQSNTTGAANMANGNQALQANTTGAANTANGHQTLDSNTTGFANTAVGSGALNLNTTGENNTCIGYRAGTSASPFHVTTQDNRIVMGNDLNTNAYINVPWTVTSDERRKTALTPVPHGLDFVCKLEPISFEFREWSKTTERDSGDAAEPSAPKLLDTGDGIARYGFSAQHVRALEGDEPVIADCEDEDFLKLHETYLIPVLVNAVKELTRKVEALETAAKK